MPDENYLYHRSRAAAGRASIGIADCHDHDETCALIRGAWAGFLLASAEVEGWDAVLHHVNELATAARVPEAAQKPNLKLVS